jgi:hypothetical protein
MLSGPREVHPGRTDPGLLVTAMQPGTLHFIAGRLAAGKTTLARKLAAEHIMPFSFVKTFGFQGYLRVSHPLMII